MKETIIQCLRQLEQQNGISILYACELGSRAYGYETKTSDYDIRFIFQYPIASYIGINPIKESIQYNHGQMECHGWDIKKAAQLAKKSNPSLIEWLQSPIIYLDQKRFSQKFFDRCKESYDLSTLRKHYERMFTKNIEQVREGKFKMLLHAIRSLLAIQYMIHEQKIPPVQLSKLLLYITDDQIKETYEAVIFEAKRNRGITGETLEQMIKTCRLHFDQLSMCPLMLNEHQQSSSSYHEFVVNWVLDNE
ncbi:nucleotidyltransferase domain-containing protein [Bacillus sp. FJAT-47783]|uniref:nucleotidyltransferase domain-containing protein n=1 Tax=Bacillus sp. FJAT-47783 TaxID=2922712 RepID=UPI001FAC56E4|nr:nucleotidyltransferase domain-containing protein [Bacillus sp. FJAT-47783]